MLTTSLAIVALAAAPAAMASATQPKTTSVSYTNGALVCSKLSGLIKFSPALKPGVTSHVSFSVASKGQCKAIANTSQVTPPVLVGVSWKVAGSASGLPKEKSTETGKGMTSTGFALGGTPAVHGLTGVTTTFAFSNLNVIRGTQGKIELQYAGTAGVASVTGAFQGTDSGFTSFGHLNLGVSLAELKAMYSSVVGVSQIEITGGRLTLQ